MPQQVVMQPAGPSADRHPSFNDLTVGDVSSGVPRIRLGEMFGSLKRQMKWFIILFLIGVAASFYLTKDLKRSYHADGVLLVQLGTEYVYDPVGSDQNNSAGLSLTPEHIVLNEVPIMKNLGSIRRVTGELEGIFGARLAPDNYEIRQRYPKGSPEYNDAVIELNTIIDRSFGVAAQPKSSILSITFEHEDPEIAIAALDGFIKAYEDFRRTIFIEGTGGIITERRIATEDQLKITERAIARLLKTNGVSNFDSERIGVTSRTEELRVTLNTLRADVSENERALATVENQLRATPEQIDLQIDDRSSQRVAQAELELGQLLAKYLPNSQPVRRKQQEIQELNRLQSSYGGEARGGRRVGPNTVYQNLLTRRNTLQSSADALREKEITVQRQLDSADAKVRKLQGLSPAYVGLLRQRDILDERLKDYTKKEQEALINEQQAQANSDNVSVIDQALDVSQARKGRNSRALLFVLGSVGWGVTLAMIAMMRVFLDPALYVGNSVRGRRQADRHSEQEPRQQSNDTQMAAAMVGAQAGQPVSYIPDPVAAPPFQDEPHMQAAQGQPEVFQESYAQNHQADPYAAPYAPENGYGQANAHSPETGYDHDRYAAPVEHQGNPYAALAHTGNAAYDIYANPYLETGAGDYGGPVDAAVLGQLPHAPHG